VYHFVGTTASEVWIKAASVLLGDDARLQASRNGATKEILHAVFVIEDPRQRWVLTRHPALNPAFAIAEIIWILSGRRDSAFLNFWNSQLPRFAGNGPIYHGAYGYRLRHAFGIDQLERAYQVLRNNVDSRQVVLTIWGANLDMPMENGQPVDEDVPCNLLSILKVRDGRLDWTQIVRSNDLFRGVPYNLLQFTMILP
jgi:thymidylate synthase